jgi:hypothetical protein
MSAGQIVERPGDPRGDDSTVGWLVGVLLTGLALSFGAPFWFDALSKLSRLRITGRRPKDD